MICFWYLGRIALFYTNKATPAAIPAARRGRLFMGIPEQWNVGLREIWKA